MLCERSIFRHDIDPGNAFYGHLMVVSPCHYLDTHPCDRNGKQVAIEILSGQHRYHAHNILHLSRFIGFTKAHDTYPLNAAEGLSKLAPDYNPQEYCPSRYRPVRRPVKRSD